MQVDEKSRTKESPLLGGQGLSHVGIAQECATTRENCVNEKSLRCHERAALWYFRRHAHRCFLKADCPRAMLKEGPCKQHPV